MTLPGQQRRGTSLRTDFLYAALIVAAAGLVFFTNLGAAALWDDDEPYYAACAREMLDRSDWVVPMFNGRLFPDKPPLMYWTMIGGFKLFGIHEFGARFGAALCGVATALGTYALGRRLFTAEVGLWGGLIVASTLIFTVSARAATVDSTLALLSVGAMLAFVYGKMPKLTAQTGAGPNVYVPHSWLAAAAMHACLAAGALAKGPIGLLLPAASIGLFLMVMNYVGRLPAAPAAASSGGWRRWLGHAVRVASPLNFFCSLWQMQPLLGILVILAVSLPWFVLVSLRTHGQWPAEFFGNYNLRPFVRPILGHTGPIWYYLPAILIGFFPWSVFLVPTLADAVRRVRQLHAWWPGYVLLACWSAVPMVFWSICSSKLPHYMVPIFPALALGTAAFLEHWFREPAIFRGRPVWIAWGVTIAAGVGIAVVIPFVAAKFLPGEGLIGLVGLILVAGGAISLHLVRRQRYRTAMGAFAAMSVLLLTAVFGLAALRVDRHQNARALMAAIRQDCPGEPNLAAYGLLEKSHVFYAGHPLPFCQNPRELARVTGDALTYVFTDGTRADEIQSRLPGMFDVLIRQPRFLRRSDVLVLVHRPQAGHAAPSTAVLPADRSRILH